MSKLAMLDPKPDLAGATPEELARALLRPLRPRSGAEAVVRNKVAVQKVAANHAGNRVLHQVERP